jgi:hypothetical protein
MNRTTPIQDLENKKYPLLQKSDGFHFNPAPILTQTKL